MSVIEKVLYDPIDPELIHSVYYDTDEDTISFTRPDKKVTYEFCTKENAASIIQKYAIKNGVLENKPKYTTSDAKITWKIIQQDKEELNIKSIMDTHIQNSFDFEIFKSYISHLHKNQHKLYLKLFLIPLTIRTIPSIIIKKE